MKQYTQEDVDRWCKENNAWTADGLFDEILPKYRKN